jgi:N-acetylmuramic acid 6-phosphate etherase
MQSLMTEQRNPRTMDIDRLSTREVLERIHAEDQYAFQAVDGAIDDIEKAVDFAVHAFENGGRLIYVGAGTSGRLGVLDATECPPTYGTDPEMVQGIIAGGWDALRRSVERAEDFPEDGAKAVQEKNVNPNDVVIGIAASSTTPYVIGALKEAHKLGAKVVFITCNPNPNTLPEADATIVLPVGPEVVTGSTRMKAGTATKLVLNMITTTSMIRIGKVYQNLMVDLYATCNKLDDRSRRIVVMLTGLSYEEADQLILAAHGKVKTALVMHLCHCSRDEAESMIDQKHGRVNEILHGADVT